MGVVVTLHLLNYVALIFIVLAQFIHIHGIGRFVGIRLIKTTAELEWAREQDKKFMQIGKKSWGESDLENIKKYATSPVPHYIAIALGFLAMVAVFISMYATRTGKLGFTYPVLAFSLFHTIMIIVCLAMFQEYILIVTLVFNCAYIAFILFVLIKENIFKKGLGAFKDDE